MKRRVLFIFILIFWMITLSTFLSIRIEKWMMPVVSQTATNDKDPYPEIPADSLFYDDMGMHIYRTRIGQGWEPGLRVWEVDAQNYFVIDGKVRFTQGAGEFIQYATRTLRVGEEVMRAEAFQYADDTWIGIYPDGIPEYELYSDKFSVQAETDTALLISAVEADLPFMEDRARAKVVIEKEDFAWYEPPTSTFYSLNDLRTFLNNVLLLSVLAAMMIFTVFLWGWSFRLSREYRENTKLLVINGGVAALLLALSPLLLHFINIPNSLLPQYHITDFSHYAAEFSEIFDTLRTFAAQGNLLAQETIRFAQLRTTLFFVILSLGVLAAAAVIFFQIVTLRASRNKPRHAAW